MRKRIALLCAMLLLCSPIVQAAQVIRYVDPDAGGGGTGVDWTNAYTSINAFCQAEGTDLVTAGDYYTVYCRSSSGTHDPGNAYFIGWVTDATHDVELIGADFPADGVYDDTAFTIDADTDNINGIILQIADLKLTNLQFLVTETSTGVMRGVTIATNGTAERLTIDSCIFKGVCSGTGAANAVYDNDTSTVVKISNTIAYGFVSGADTDFKAISLNRCTTANILNCTIYGNYIGVQRSILGTVNVINSAVGNNTDDFAGAITVDYCCTAAGEGTNAQTPSGGDWANEFTTPGTDFSLLVGGNCVGTGTDDPGSGLYSDDIIGTARSSTWDIGAFEYYVAPPSTGGGQVIIIGMD